MPGSNHMATNAFSLSMFAVLLFSNSVHPRGVIVQEMPGVGILLEPRRADSRWSRKNSSSSSFLPNAKQMIYLPDEVHALAGELRLANENVQQPTGLVRDGRRSEFPGFAEIGVGEPESLPRLRHLACYAGKYRVGTAVPQGKNALLVGAERSVPLALE